jgi:hypothetical protein
MELDTDIVGAMETVNGAMEGAEHGWIMEDKIHTLPTFI